MYGHVTIRLQDVSNFNAGRVPAKTLNKQTYVGVDNLLQNRLGKVDSSYVPKEGNCSRFDKDNILVGNIRPYLKKIWMADCDGGTNGDVLVFVANKELVLPRYLYFVLASDKFFSYAMQHSKGAKMPRGDKNSIMSYLFSIPTIDVQQKTINILEHFEQLVNNISKGIPAEIKARNDQYEYYRDKLLQFKEIAE